MDAAKKHLLGTLLAFLTGITSGLASEEGDLTDPWSVTTARPVVAGMTNAEDRDASQGSAYCFVLLAFYQDYMSIVTSSKCTMSPSCSNYSIDAIGKYGALRGVVLTADRLIHEWDEQQYAPITLRNGHGRYLDPVEDNILWSLNK